MGRLPAPGQCVRPGVIVDIIMKNFRVVPIVKVVHHEYNNPLKQVSFLNVHLAQL